MISRSINKDGNIFPSMFNLVDSLPIKTIHNERYGYRTPTLIASRSITRIFEAFTKVYKEHDYTLGYYRQYGKIEDYKIVSELEKSIVELLESIASYVDDCNTLFKITSPLHGPKDKDVVVWLKKTNHPYRNEFFHSIKEYHDNLKKIVNDLKHQNGKLNIVIGILGSGETIIAYSLPYMSKTPDNEYAEIVDLNDLNNLLLNLRYHFYNIYLISDRLTEYITKSIEHYYGIDLEVKSHNRVNEFENIFHRINQKHHSTFPVEVKYEAPQICVKYDISNLLMEKIGRTKENENFCMVFNIEGENADTHRIMLIPKQKVLDEFKEHSHGIKNGESGKFEFVDSDENVYKVYLTLYPNEVQAKTYMEYNFDDMFYLKVCGDWTIALIINSNLDFPKKHIVNFNKKLLDKDEPIQYVNFDWNTGLFKSYNKND